MTALGMLLMVVSLIAWVWMEKRRLDEQAAMLRSAAANSGAKEETMPREKQIEFPREAESGQVVDTAFSCWSRSPASLR